MQIILYRPYILLYLKVQYLLVISVSSIVSPNNSLCFACLLLMIYVLSSGINVLVVKLTVSQLVKKYLLFSGCRKLLTVRNEVLTKVTIEVLESCEMLYCIVRGYIVQ